jgi:hypothetical protein
MTIIDAKEKTDEVEVDIRKLISDGDIKDPDLPDIDRGIKLLSDTIFSHTEDENDYSTIITDLIERNETSLHQVATYNASKKRWHTWKWVGICLTVTTVAIVLFADLFDQSLDTTEGSEKTFRRVLISVGAAGTALTAAFSAFSYYMEGKRNARYKRELGLQQPDNELVKKLRMILENWGALQRAQDDYRSQVDVNKSAKQCFKHIKDLPEDKGLPPKSCMASVTLQLLNEEHPAKRSASKIKELEESISPRSSLDEDNKAFKDLGQKGSIDFRSSIPPKISKAEYEIACQWKDLQQAMGGLYIDEFYFGENRIYRRDAKPAESINIIIDE